MKGPGRGPAGERHRAIVAAAKGTLAEKGFGRTTARALPPAPGVSEGLLSTQCPGKKSLDAAMLAACVNGLRFAGATQFATRWARNVAT